MAYRFQYMGRCVILDKGRGGFLRGRDGYFRVIHAKRTVIFMWLFPHEITVPNSLFYRYDGSNPPLALCADISGLDSL